jgi:ribosomal protein S18 acetylase RimI-like enzyme
VTIAVRAATPRDVDQIVETAVGAWEEGFRGIVPPRIDPRRAWDPERVRARLSDGERETQNVVAELDGRVRGYIVFGPSRDRDAPRGVGEIWALYVHPGAWRRGVGRALVEHAKVELAAAGCRAASLWTLAGSRLARAFYEACGFEADGVSQRRESLGYTLEVRYRVGLRKKSR